MTIIVSLGQFLHRPRSVTATPPPPELTLKNWTSDLRGFDGTRHIVVIELSQANQISSDVGPMLGEADNARIFVLPGAMIPVAEPFNITDLLSLVRSVLSKGIQLFEGRDQLFCGGGLTVNFLSREVMLEGREIKLTPTEYSLLCELVTNPGISIKHQDLLTRVWGSDYVDALEPLKVHIQRLRRKLNDKAEEPRFIATERGVGYKFIAGSSSPSDSNPA